MPLPESTVNQLMNARHLYYMAKRELDSGQAIRLFAGTNLLHDAVEALLWAAASYKGISRDRAEIMQLFDVVSLSLSPATLPFRPTILQLNKVRINSKHYGICPDRKELSRLFTSMTEFLREATEIAFGVSFHTVSLLDFLEDGEIKSCLSSAQLSFSELNYQATLIECRKALYLLFENWYDIEKFKDVDAQPIGILAGYSKAPYYTRSPEWIAKYVCDPFDYIQIDHDVLDKELLTLGIEPTSYWNIWRGTPAVYRYAGTKEWLVKRDLKVEVGIGEEHAAYVLEQTIDIALRVAEDRRQVRQLHHGNFSIRLLHDAVNVYVKADRTSPVSGVTEPGLRVLSVTESTAGLNDAGPYWKVSHIIPGRGLINGGGYYGYVHEDDVDWSHDNATP